MLCIIEEAAVDTDETGDDYVTFLLKSLFAPCKCYEESGSKLSLS